MALDSDNEELFDDFITNDSNANLTTPLRNTLVLEDIIDLTLPIFDTNDNGLHDKENDHVILDPSNLEYDLEALVDSFLQEGF